MKKFLAILLILCMALSLCACGTSGSSTSGDSGSAPDTGKTPDSGTQTSGGEAAATWPNGDITIYTGYATGSLTDVNVRTIADWITKQTGVNVIIENNDVGGGANLAAKLAKAEPDGQTLMLIGMNCISNYYNGTWALNPADPSVFKIACGSIQPFPDSGCMVMTQADSPYDTWDELAAYAAEHPGEVTVASIAGKVMDIKMKALFNGTGVADNIRWVSTTNADATAALLGNNIDIIMLDEVTAVSYLQDGSCKALLNVRVNDDFSLYGDDPAVETIRTVPNLEDVFGDDAANYMVANRSMFCVPAGTPDEIVEQIAAIVDAIDLETEGEFYDRCRTNGGTSKYYTWPGDEIMAEWQRLDPIIKEIVEMG